MKKAVRKHSYQVGDTVCLNLQASEVITHKFENSAVKIKELIYDAYFGPCYHFEGFGGSWPESCIAYLKDRG